MIKLIKVSKKQFAFFNTKSKTFLSFSGKQAWKYVDEFIIDYDRLDSKLIVDLIKLIHAEFPVYKDAFDTIIVSHSNGKITSSLFKYENI